MKLEDIASVTHEANRAYCAAIGDASQLPWAEAPAWQKESAVKGVQFVLDHHGPDPVGQHESWCIEKHDSGWTHGVVKDEVAKTHPCLVPYDQLPKEQQAKDALFGAVAQALIPYLTD